MSTTANSPGDDSQFDRFCRDVLGVNIHETQKQVAKRVKGLSYGVAGRSRLSQLVTRQALDEGNTVMHCCGRCQYCGGPAVRTLRHERVASKWTLVQVETCTESLAGITNPRPPERRCPEVRTTP